VSGLSDNIACYAKSDNGDYGNDKNSKNNDNNNNNSNGAYNAYNNYYSIRANLNNGNPTESVKNESSIDQNTELRDRKLLSEKEGTETREGKGEKGSKGEKEKGGKGDKEKEVIESDCGGILDVLRSTLHLVPAERKSLKEIAEFAIFRSFSPSPYAPPSTSFSANLPLSPQVCHTKFPS
jgi:hypothetical protein